MPGRVAAMPRCRKSCAYSCSFPTSLLLPPAAYTKVSKETESHQPSIQGLTRTNYFVQSYQHNVRLFETQVSDPKSISCHDKLERVCLEDLSSLFIRYFDSPKIFDTVPDFLGRVN